MGSSQMQNPPIASLDLDGGPLRPDQPMARAANEALVGYFRDLKSGRIEATLARDVIDTLPPPAEPHLDQNGYWRMGAWLLESRSRKLALTYRPMQLEQRLEYVATLRHDDNRLEVTSLTMRQLYPRK